MTADQVRDDHPAKATLLGRADEVIE